jgi:hypothetical protein
MTDLYLDILDTLKKTYDCNAINTDETTRIKVYNQIDAVGGYNSYPTLKQLCINDYLNFNTPSIPTPSFIGGPSCLTVYHSSHHNKTIYIFSEIHQKALDWDCTNVGGTTFNQTTQMSVEDFLFTLLKTSNVFLDIFIETAPFHKQNKEYPSLYVDGRLTSIHNKLNKCIHSETRSGISYCTAGRIHWIDNRRSYYFPFVQIDNFEPSELTTIDQKNTIISNIKVYKDDLLKISELTDNNEIYDYASKKIIAYVTNSKQIKKVDGMLGLQIQSFLLSELRKDIYANDDIYSIINSSKKILEIIDEPVEKIDFNHLSIWITIFRSEIRNFGVFMMDYYTLMRMFKTFEKKKDQKFDQPTKANNIIIYAGQTHSNRYGRCLQHLGFRIYEQTGTVIVDQKKETKNCINTDGIRMPFFKINKQFIDGSVIPPPYDDDLITATAIKLSDEVNTKIDKHDIDYTKKLCDNLIKTYDCKYLDVMDPLLKYSFYTKITHCVTNKIVLKKLFDNFFQNRYNKDNRPAPLYIGGPNSLTVHYDPKENKNIYIFGDMYDSHMNCNEVGLQTDDSMMSIEDFLVTLLKTTDAFLDIFLDVSLDNNTYRQDLRINQIYEKLKKCIKKDSRNDVECLLGRVHWTEINPYNNLTHQQYIDLFNEISSAHQKDPDRGIFNFFDIKLRTNVHNIKKFNYSEQSHRVFRLTPFMSEELERKINNYGDNFPNNINILLNSATRQQDEINSAIEFVKNALRHIGDITSDFYTLSRMYKPYRIDVTTKPALHHAIIVQPKPAFEGAIIGDQPKKAHNIIVYAGEVHSNRIRKFLTSQKIIMYERTGILGENKTCIKTRDITMPFFNISELSDDWIKKYANFGNLNSYSSIIPSLDIYDPNPADYNEGNVNPQIFDERDSNHPTVENGDYSNDMIIKITGKNKKFILLNPEYVLEFIKKNGYWSIDTDENLKKILLNVFVPSSILLPDYIEATTYTLCNTPQRCGLEEKEKISAGVKNHIFLHYIPFAFVFSLVKVS